MIKSPRMEKQYKTTDEGEEAIDGEAEGEQVNSAGGKKSTQELR